MRISNLTPLKKVFPKIASRAELWGLSILVTLQEYTVTNLLWFQMGIKNKNGVRKPDMPEVTLSVRAEKDFQRKASISPSSSSWRCSAPSLHRSQASQMRHPERRTKLLWKIWLYGKCQETILLSLEFFLIALGTRLHLSSQLSFTAL